MLRVASGLLVVLSSLPAAQSRAARAGGEILQATEPPLREGRPAESEELLRKALRQNPGLAGAHFRLGLLLADRRDLVAAINELRVAVSIAPREPRYVLALGMVYREAGNRDEALNAFRRVLSLEPGHAEAARWSAEIARETNHDAESLSILEKAFTRNPDPRTARALAECYVLADRPAKAVALLRDTLTHNPQSAQVMLALGELLEADLSTRPEAGKLLRAAVKAAPQSAASRFALGNYLLAEGSASEAAKHLREAARLRPQDSRIRYSLAHALLRSGRAEEGQGELTEFRRQAEEEEQRKSRHRRFGQGYQRGLEAVQRNDLSAARQALQEALVASPEAPAYALLSKVLYSMNRVSEAAVVIEEAIRLEPGNGEYRYLRGLFRLRQKQWEEALADFRAAEALLPSLADIYNQKGNALAALGMWHEATTAYRQAADRDPGEASYLLNLSLALKSAGRLRESEEVRACYERRKSR